MTAITTLAVAAHVALPMIAALARAGKDPRPQLRAILGVPRLSRDISAHVASVEANVAARKPVAVRPAPSLASRNETWLRAAVAAAYWQCDYRTCGGKWAGGEHTLRVVEGPASCNSYTERAWSDNGKWSGINSTHVIQVPRLWRTRVPARLRVVDGLLTLDLWAPGSIPGHETERDEAAGGSAAIDAARAELGLTGCWRAAVVEQSRGTAIRATWCWMLETTAGLVVHGSTLRGALRTLRARSAGAPSAAVGTASVDYAAARSAGLCEVGIRDWCARHGVDPAGRYTLAELLVLADGDRCDLVRRAAAFAR